MIGTRTFAVIAVLAATVGAVAGVAVGAAFAVASDRARNLWQPIDWDGADD